MINAVRKVLPLCLWLLLSMQCIGQQTSLSVDSTKPLAIGSVLSFRSQVLDEKRVLNIYLPEGYNPNDSISYPVIYLLDGAVNEDFLHVVGLVQFSSAEWVAQLPKSIVVGIVNVDRKRDFTFPSTLKEETATFPSSGHSERFINFLETELQPFIDKKYRTSASKTIIGESLGGLLATEILFSKPHLFSRYIIVSPSLWWNDGSLLKQDASELGNNIKDTTTVYIGVGKEGLAPSKNRHVMEEDARKLADKLKGITSNRLRVLFDYLSKEDHATIMHQAVYNALRIMERP